MRLGIMQPYFFPYLGYFELIQLSDDWVVFETVKYKPKSWMNRNRILHPRSGWQYVSTPIEKHTESGLIKDARQVDPGAARERILGQIDHYRLKRAPYFDQVRELIERSFARAGSSLLADVNVSSLEEVCAYLDLEFRPRRLSEMGLDIPPIEHAGQWAVEISDLLGAPIYINAPGGRGIFHPEEFAARGIELLFLVPRPMRYATPGYEFVENLSILDVMMWNAPERIREHVAGAALAP
ncbi:MAG TPA: WbqC family protein [Caulobacteraceae bacterium]|nr:WbqC family protein [Caulobacteraceae bacterium]